MRFVVANRVTQLLVAMSAASKKRQKRSAEDAPIDGEKSQKAAKYEEDETANKRQAEKKPTVSSTRRVVIKPTINRNEPNFYNLCYCLKPCTTHNVPTFRVKDLHKCYELLKNDASVDTFYLCLLHGPQTAPTDGCLHCVELENFTYTFVVQTRFRCYTFVQPSLYVSKNFNYFKSFVYTSVDHYRLKRAYNIEDAKRVELTFYNNFMSNEFKGGELKTIVGGKTSFIRNKILGFHTLGLRLTLTIDCRLGPNYISIPKRLYEELNLATPYVIINRAPSINSKCIYVVEMLCGTDEHDNTIHISPFFTNGLHADQDGDDLTVFYLKRSGETPSITMQAAITELRMMSWKYGRRYDFAYRPRYSFTQYHHYILHVFDDYFKERNELWRRLGGTSRARCKLMMELGCSIMRDEVDDFIRLLIEFTGRLDCELTSAHDMLTGGGSLKAVVESGAKGSDDHISIFLNNLYNLDPNYKRNLIAGFDKYVDASTHMSAGGTRQFTLLYGVNSIYLHNNNIYANDSVILRNVHDSHLMSAIFYNKHAVNYVNEELLKDERV